MLIHIQFHLMQMEELHLHRQVSQLYIELIMESWQQLQEKITHSTAGSQPRVVELR